MPFNFQEGELLLVNKPLEWTSFDVVNKIKRSLKIKKVGHAGTLDPLATGLLLIATGKQTKALHQLQFADKAYKAEILLGKTTPSYDLETEFDSETDASHITEEQVLKILKTFEGAQQQQPPQFSAIKVNGKAAYKSARKGEEVKLKLRDVVLHKVELTSSSLPKIEVEVQCSKGTYIRSLAHDLGAALGVGGTLVGLVRTQVGKYKLNDAWELEKLIDTAKAEQAAAEQ